MGYLLPHWLAGFGVVGGGAPGRAEVHGVRSGAAVLGGGGRVYGHPAYRVGHRPGVGADWRLDLRLGVNPADGSGAGW